MSVVGPDVLGDEPSARADRPSVVAVAGGSLVLGALLGAVLTASWLGPEADRTEPSPPAGVPADGVVYACGGHAVAVVHVAGLPPGRTEVHLPLRGDGVLLPVLADGARVFVGEPDGHQTFVPDGGQITMAQQVAVPRGDAPTARVGERSVALTVRRCAGGR